MKKAILLCLFTIFLGISTFSQSGKNEEIISVVKKMSEAQGNYDPMALEEVYASDYVEISPKGEVDVREKAIGFYKIDDAEKIKASSPKYLLDEFSVRDHKQFAIVIARLSFGSRSDPQKPSVVAARVVFALRREKGKWKIYSAQFTPIPRQKDAKSE